MTDIVERLRFDAVRCELQFSKGVAGNIDEAANEIERLRGTWRPIDTAPKDGAEVWLGAAHEEPGRRRVAVGYWFGKRGWVGSHDEESLGWTPTHWRSYFIPMAPGV